MFKKIISALTAVSLFGSSPPVFAQLSVTPTSSIGSASSASATNGIHPNVLKFFLRAAQESGQYDEANPSRSVFDFAAFANNPCFNPKTRWEEDPCKRQFGGNFRLKDLLKDETLMEAVFQAILASHPSVNREQLATRLMRSFKRFTEELNLKKEQREDGGYIPLPLDWKSEDEEHTVSEHDKREHRTRSQQLWKICERKFGAKHKNLCYMQNQRLVRTTSIAIHERNIYYRAK